MLITIKKILVIGLLLLLAGCSSAPVQTDNEIPAMHQASDYIKDDIEYAVDIYDPWERMNRSIYNFNTKFDRYIFLPVVNLYQTLLPDFVETSISNFFSNIGEISNFANSIAQLKPESSVNTFLRFFFNSTLGLFGFVDIATPMGIPEQEEDFGQTLGHYGVGEGPFLILPFFGPSNLRDTVGLAGDTALMSTVDPLNLDDHSDREYAYYSVKATSKRSDIDFRYYETGSPFEYEMVRLLYSKWRQIQIQK